MEYTKLGQTGLEVSKLCLGCMSFSDPNRGFHAGWVLYEEASRQIIKKALDAGINFFDTANIYGYGSSEEILGQALKDFTNREEVVIATKLFFGDGSGSGRNTTKLSRKAIFAQVEASSNACRRIISTYFTSIAGTMILRLKKPWQPSMIWSVQEKFSIWEHLPCMLGSSKRPNT